MCGCRRRATRIEVHLFVGSVCFWASRASGASPANSDGTLAFCHLCGVARAARRGGRLEGASEAELFFVEPSTDAALQDGGALVCAHAHTHNIPIVSIDSNAPCDERPPPRSGAPGCCSKTRLLL